MQDVRHVSSTLPLEKVLCVKTIKQYVKMCKQTLKKREINRRKKGMLNLDLIEVGLEATVKAQN